MGLGQISLALGKDVTMWKYEKKLQFPVNIKKKNIKMAKYIITQCGGANGELGATLRYLNQRYTMPDDFGKSELTDIATEEMGHDFYKFLINNMYLLLNLAIPDTASYKKSMLQSSSNEKFTNLINGILEEEIIIQHDENGKVGVYKKPSAEHTG